MKNIGLWFVESPTLVALGFFILLTVIIITGWIYNTSLNKTHLLISDYGDDCDDTQVLMLALHERLCGTYDILITSGDTNKRYQIMENLLQSYPNLYKRSDFLYVYYLWDAIPWIVFNIYLGENTVREINTNISMSVPVKQFFSLFSLKNYTDVYVFAPVVGIDLNKMIKDIAGSVFIVGERYNSINTGKGLLGDDIFEIKSNLMFLEKSAPTYYFSSKFTRNIKFNSFLVKKISTENAYKQYVDICFKFLFSGRPIHLPSNLQLRVAESNYNVLKHIHAKLDNHKITLYQINHKLIENRSMKYVSRFKLSRLESQKLLEVTIQIVTIVASLTGSYLMPHQENPLGKHENEDMVYHYVKDYLLLNNVLTLPGYDAFVFKLVHTNLMNYLVKTWFTENVCFIEEQDQSMIRRCQEMFSK